MNPASARRVEDGPTEICQYRAIDGRSRASVSSAYRFEGVNGLELLYRNREFIEVFTPGALDGFPTLLTNAETADSCDLYIGVADDQILAATANTLRSSKGPPACVTARAMASAALSNLPQLR